VKDTFLFVHDGGIACSDEARSEYRRAFPVKKAFHGPHKILPAFGREVIACAHNPTVSPGALRAPVSPFGSIRRNAICRAPSSVLRRVATSEQLAWTESQVTTAISRTPLWLASGWECRGRRLSRERGSPGKRCGLCRCRPLTHRRDPVQGARALLAESLEK